ncbi:hypothetical protein PTET_a0294 [Pseudoalteromonas tetraodonis]|nr:hypothetical protein PTET_a0294 [Pseudoalteromonas tetraodonis]
MVLNKLKTRAKRLNFTLKHLVSSHRFLKLKLSNRFIYYSR